LRLQVRYYPPFDALTGVKEEEVTLQSPRITVSELLTHLAERHEKLRSYINTRDEEGFGRHMLVALDVNLVRLTDVLEDGDKVKILPPMAGGALRV